jgi:transposase
MEVITRSERRRTYSEAEKAVIADASAPGVTVREVSRRLGIAESLIYNWRSAQRKARSTASEPLQFISHGVVTGVTRAEPRVAISSPTPTSCALSHRRCRPRSFTADLPPVRRSQDRPR